jgi:hypothetical protein
VTLWCNKGQPIISNDTKILATPLPVSAEGYQQQPTSQGLGLIEQAEHKLQVLRNSSTKKLVPTSS